MVQEATEATFSFLVISVLLVVDAIQTLISIKEKGIFKDPKQVLLNKTNKELKALLVGVKKKSNLNKTQLVDLVLANS